MLQLYSELEANILKDITRRLLEAGEMPAATSRLACKQKKV